MLVAKRTTTAVAAGALIAAVVALGAVACATDDKSRSSLRDAGAGGSADAAVSREAATHEGGTSGGGHGGTTDVIPRDTGGNVGTGGTRAAFHDAARGGPSTTDARVANGGGTARGSDASFADAGSRDASVEVGPPTDAGARAFPVADGGFHIASHPRAPEVQYQGGPVLAKPQITAITYDEYDQRSGIEQFVGALASSAGSYWTPATKDYGVGTPTILPPIHVSLAAPEKIDDLDIQAWLAGMLDGTHVDFGTPTTSTIYAIFYPTTTTVTNSGTAGCSSFGGYHSSILIQNGPWKDLNVPYAVIPECDSLGDTLDTTTDAASHELVESATDPFGTTTSPGFGWDLDDADHRIWDLTIGGGEGEVTDLCEGFYGENIFPFGGFPYLIQRSWSNSAARASHDPCVPELAGTPAYFNAAPVLTDAVTIEYGGHAYPTTGALIPLAQKKTIEVDLFSDLATDPWTVSARDTAEPFDGISHLSFAWDATTGQNGTKLHLTITALAGSTRFGGEPFIIESSNGGPHHEWLGYVGQH